MDEEGQPRNQASESVSICRGGSRAKRRKDSACTLCGGGSSWRTCVLRSRLAEHPRHVAFGSGRFYPDGICRTGSAQCSYWSLLLLGRRARTGPEPASVPYYVVNSGGPPQSNFNQSTEYRYWYCSPVSRLSPHTPPPADPLRYCDVDLLHPSRRPAQFRLCTYVHTLNPLARRGLVPRPALRTVLAPLLFCSLTTNSRSHDYSTCVPLHRVHRKLLPPGRRSRYLPW